LAPASRMTLRKNAPATSRSMVGTRDIGCTPPLVCTRVPQACCSGLGVFAAPEAYRAPGGSLPLEIGQQQGVTWLSECQNAACNGNVMKTFGGHCRTRIDALARAGCRRNRVYGHFPRHRRGRLRPRRRWSMPGLA
jgi:hypothetical protein